MLLAAVRWDARKTGGGPCCQARTTTLPGQDGGAARSTPIVLLGARWCCCKVPWRGYHVAAVLLPAWWCGATGVVARRLPWHGGAARTRLCCWRYYQSVRRCCWHRCKGCMGRGGGATTGVDTLLVVLHTGFDELPAVLLLDARHILCYTIGAAKLSRRSCEEVLSELQSCFIGAANLSCRSCKQSCKVVSPELHAAKVGAAKVSRWSCKAIRSKLQRCLAGATKVSCRSCKRRTLPRAVMVLQARHRAFSRCCKPSVANAAAAGERFVAKASCSSGGSGGPTLVEIWVLAPVCN
jgi:hypothetical protein